MPKNFVPDVVLTLSKSEKTNFGTYHAIQVVRWIVDGKVNVPKLEKREWYLDKRSGEERNKAVAFTLSEFDMIVEKAKEIREAMTNPPPYVQAEAQKTEEVEF